MSSTTITTSYDPKTSGVSIEFDGLYFIVKDADLADADIGQFLDACTPQDGGRATMELDEPAEEWFRLLAVVCQSRPITVRAWEQ